MHADIQYRAAKGIGKYILFILFIFGCVGNLLSFAVMIRRTMRSSSTAFYMAALALADTLVMVTGCLRRWALEAFEEDLLNVSAAACSTINFIQYWSFDVAVWILVVMTIDRTIVVTSPLKAYVHTTRRRAVIALVSVMVICALINIHFFFTTEYWPEMRLCTGKEDYYEFYSAVWTWVDATVYSFLPFVLLLAMNIIIIVFLSKANVKKQNMTNIFKDKRKQEQKNAIKSRKLSIMLLSVTSAFILLTGPAVMTHILREERENFFNQENPTDIARYILVRQIMRVLLYMNHSINFLLYCVTGSKFRNELTAMIRCQSVRDRRRRSTILSIPNGSSTNIPNGSAANISNGSCTNIKSSSQINIPNGSLLSIPIGNSTNYLGGSSSSVAKGSSSNLAYSPTTPERESAM